MLSLLSYLKKVRRSAILKLTNLIIHRHLLAKVLLLRIQFAVAKLPIQEFDIKASRDLTQLTMLSTSADGNQPSTLQQPSQNRITASPLAKRLGAQNNIDLTRLKGTGPHHRIIKADVLESLNNSKTLTRGTSSLPASIIYDEPSFQTVKLTNIRKVIAKRLSESKQNVPHFYLNVDCNMDALLKAREEINHGISKDQKISVNDFIIKAMAHAMQDVPEANASWEENHIKYFDRIDIAVAVAIEGGLITPVIFDAYNRSLSDISSSIKSLAVRARDNKLNPKEYQGGTISLSNLGMYGIKSFSAIVNPPQACILAVGRASLQPVIIDNQIKVGSIMSCTLSVDHRVVDGAVGARYLSCFQNYIESPVKLFYR